MRPEMRDYLRAVGRDDPTCAWVGTDVQVDAEEAGFTEASPDVHCGSRLTEAGRDAVCEHERS